MLIKIFFLLLILVTAIYCEEEDSDCADLGWTLDRFTW